MILVFAVLLLSMGCAPKAADKVGEAEHDLAEAWEAERDAAVAEMKASIDATSREIEKMHERIAELEAEGQAEAAEAWRRTAAGLEAARDAAAREVEVLEKAGAEAWESTKDSAAAAIKELERVGERAAAFASEAKDEFVAEARAAVEEGERELAWAKEKLAEADEAAREDWQKVVNKLEQKQRKLVAELQKIEEAGSDAWAELRHGFVAAYHDLRDASKRAMKRLGEI